jgi:RimJ/RimL family protein N-acetyltransferase
MNTRRTEEIDVGYTTATQTNLTIVTEPTWEQLNMWWADMHADPEDIQVAFNDLMSHDLDTFLEQDLIWAFVYQEHRLVTVCWLHDITRDEHDTPVEGWIGGWVAKPFRCATGKTACLKVIEAFLEQGVRHIHSSVNVANHGSYRWTRRAMGFTAVGIFQGLSPYKGIATDCHILTLNPEDTTRVWQRAEALAHQRWPERYAQVQLPEHDGVQEEIQIKGAREESMILA